MDKIKIKKGFGPYDRQPRKNLHTAISVNKPKLSVTKHDQTLILAHMYIYTHTHTHRGGAGVGGLLIICRFEEMSF